jgi:hypothetical protein
MPSAMNVGKDGVPILSEEERKQQYWDNMWKYAHPNDPKVKEEILQGQIQKGMTTEQYQNYLNMRDDPGKAFTTGTEVLDKNQVSGAPEWAQTEANRYDNFNRPFRGEMDQSQARQREGMGMLEARAQGADALAPNRGTMQYQQALAQRMAGPRTALGDRARMAGMNPLAQQAASSAGEAGKEQMSAKAGYLGALDNMRKQDLERGKTEDTYNLQLAGQRQGALGMGLADKQSQYQQALALQQIRTQNQLASANKAAAENAANKGFMGSILNTDGSIIPGAATLLNGLGKKDK